MKIFSTLLLTLLPLSAFAAPDELVRNFSREHGLSEGTAKEELSAVFQAIASELEERRAVVIRNFGRFEVVDRKAKRRNVSEFDSDDSEVTRPAVIFIPSPTLLEQLRAEAAEGPED